MDDETILGQTAHAQARDGARKAENDISASAQGPENNVLLDELWKGHNGNARE